LLALGFAVLLAGGKAAAEEPSAQTLKEVVVEGSRDAPGAGRADPVTFATVLKPDSERHRALTLSDLLRQSVGVDVKGFGGLGGFATVSVRGSTAEQVQIFLDGVLLNRASSGSVNLADIPLGQIERIEVYRGLTPAQFGAAGPGGVVNIVTRSGASAERTTFDVSFGSYETFEFNASHSGPHRFGDFLVSANAQRSEGNFYYLSNNGTPLNPTDDEVVRRRNNAFGSGGGLAKGTFRFGSQLLRLTAEGMARTQGVPGIDALQTLRASFDTYRIVGKVDYEHALALPKTNLYVSAFSTAVRDAFRDPAGEIGLGPHSTTTAAQTPGATARLQAFPSAAHALSALLEVRHDDVESTGVGVGRTTVTRAHRLSLAVTAEDQISVLEGRLVLNPSARLDAVWASFSGDGPPDSQNVEGSGKIGLRATLVPGFFFRANAGRFFRVPTLTELFGDTGLIRGNPLLRPELGYTFDAGFTFEHRTKGLVRRLFAEAVYFESHFEDLILFSLNAQGVAIADNLSAAVVRGVELQTALALELGLSVSAGYTFQRAESDAPDRTQGKLLPGRPEHKLTARGSYERGSWRLFYELIAISGNFIDRFERVALDSRILHSAGVAWRALRPFTVSAEIQNFTDNRAVDLYRFPLPGRSFFAKLSAEF
jgi:iron complex outermembrane receptor protein